MNENPRKFSPRHRTLNVFAVETFRPFPGPTLLPVASPTARPPLCSHQSIPAVLPPGAVPRATALQLQQGETHTRAHSILRQIWSVKTTGNPLHLGVILPKAFHYAQTKTDLLKLIFRWHLDGCDTVWVWMGLTLCRAGGDSAI